MLLCGPACLQEAALRIAAVRPFVRVPLHKSRTKVLAIQIDRKVIVSRVTDAAGLKSTRPKSRSQRTQPHIAETRFEP